MTRTLIIFLFFNLAAFGQIDDVKTEQFRKRAFEIDKNLRENVSCQIDSINIDFSESPKKIKANNYFRYSRTGVEIEYYLESGKPFFITVKMLAPLSEYYWRENQFYIENDKVFSEIEMFGQSSVVHGVAIPQEAIEDPYKYYHYNRKLNADFFHGYIFELLKKIKNQR